MEIGEEEDEEGIGQPNWLIISSSSSLIRGGHSVMTIARIETMSMVSRPVEWGCSHVESAYVVR